MHISNITIHISNAVNYSFDDAIKRYFQYAKSHVAHYNSHCN